jgi:hypothetical protein
MSEKTNDGGPAFPSGVVRKTRQRPHDAGSDFIVSDIAEPRHPGLSLRDYFAAKALMGLLAEPIGECQSTASYMAESIEGDQPGDLLARAAYRLADAMIRARSKS